MSEKTIDDTMDVRVEGCSALHTVLSKEQNIRILEKYVYEISESESPENTDETYRQHIYQVIGDILEGSKLSAILENIKTGHLGWKHPHFSEWQMRMDEQDDFIENPFEVEEGVLECRKVLENGQMCGSKRVFSYSRQDRSSDEGTSVYAQCAKCGNRWRERG